MNVVTAFFDDSGTAEPGTSEYFCFGMVVVDATHLRDLSRVWLETTARHTSVSAETLLVNGLEAKSADLYEMQRRLERGQTLSVKQRHWARWGPNDAAKVKLLIADIWAFLENPPHQLKYIASVAKKELVWQRFQKDDFDRWEALKAAPKKTKGLRRDLSKRITETCYLYLMQRLQFLGEDPDFTFSDAIVIGDDTTTRSPMWETQADAQAGFDKFTDLSRIANNVCFGSSLHNPGLQMADWIAFAVRTWASGSVEGAQRLESLLPLFRGYPSVGGRGIIFVPDASAFRPLP